MGAIGTPGIISRDTLDRLVNVGRRNGGLTSEDLRRALPVGSMSAEDLALVAMHLEEEGVPVELDESLLGLTQGDGRNPGSGSDVGAIVLPPADGAAPRSRPSVVSGPLPSPEGRASEPSLPRDPRNATTPKVAVIVGLVVLAIAALGIALASG